MNHEAAGAAHFGERDDWFEGCVNDFAATKRVLEDVRCLSKSFFHVTTIEVRVESHIRTGPPLQVLKIGKRARRTYGFMDDWGVRIRGSDLIKYRFQGIVFHRDEIGRFFRNVRIICKNDGHRLADMPDLVQGEDRLVMERGTVVWICEGAPNIFTADNGINAIYRSCGICIDPDNSSMRYRTAKDFSMEHTG
jgi:hypothetical protein